MPRVPDALINSVIYLYPDLDDAQCGSEIGGSGFLLAVPSDAGKEVAHVYVITCCHVILGGATVVRTNLKDKSSGYERTFCMNFSKDDWVTHPEHDLAVCPLPYDAEIHRYDASFIDPSFVLTLDQFREMNVGPGDDLLYIGRFMGHAGKFQNMPSVRFGNISMNPSEDEPLEYEEPGTHKQKRQAAFLVEARSRSGYSGSPVFLISPLNKSNPRFLTMMFGELRFLGIDFMHIPEKVMLFDPQGFFHGQKWQVEVHAGMMGVIPSWYLLDFIDTSPRLIEQRRRDDEFYAKQLPLPPS
jgi:hypothetical protein